MFDHLFIHIPRHSAAYRVPAARVDFEASGLGGATTAGPVRIIRPRHRLCNQDTEQCEPPLPPALSKYLLELFGLRQIDLQLNDEVFLHAHLMSLSLFRVRVQLSCLFNCYSFD